MPSPTPGPSDGATNSRLGNYVLLGLLAGTAVVLFDMVRIFLVPVVMAAVFSGFFYPFYSWLRRRLGGRAGLSALLCCMLLLIGLLGPAYIIADLVVREAVTLYNSIEMWALALIDGGGVDFYAEIQALPWPRFFNLDHLDWQRPLQDTLKTVAGWATSAIDKTSRGTVQLLANIFVTFFTMFYFFRDGERLVERLKVLSPMDERYERGLIERFASVSRATVKGTLLIGLIQGTLGGLTLWIFGFNSPVLWGVVMVVLSIIPLVGSWMVLYPVAIYQMLSGNFWTGLAIFLISALLISSVDNFIRPWLVGRDTGMHDLIIFFSTLGGITVFGVMGFILGPIIAALFLTLLEFYSAEYSEKSGVAPPAADGARPQAISLPVKAQEAEPAPQAQEQAREENV